MHLNQAELGWLQILGVCRFRQALEKLRFGRDTYGLGSA